MAACRGCLGQWENSTPYMGKKKPEGVSEVTLISHFLKSYLFDIIYSYGYMLGISIVTDPSLKELIV